MGFAGRDSMKKIIASVCVALCMGLFSGSPAQSFEMPPYSVSQPNLANAKFSKIQVVVSGSSFVGSTLRVTKVRSKPSVRSFKVQWTRDGQPISYANSAKYKLSPNDAGTQIRARVTLVRAGMKTRRVNSFPVLVQSRLEQSISQRFPGFPRIVGTSSVDDRVASWFSTNSQLVELAPGIYTPYNPNVPNISLYVETAPVSGDCIMKSDLFSGRSGVCWDGVESNVSSSQKAVKVKPPTASEIAFARSTISSNNRQIQSNDELIATYASDLAVKEYQLTVAIRYQDQLRQSSLEAQILTLKNNITNLEAENTAYELENSELEKIVSG